MKREPMLCAEAAMARQLVRHASTTLRDADLAFDEDDDGVVACAEDELLDVLQRVRQFIDPLIQRLDPPPGAVVYREVTPVDLRPSGSPVESE